MKHLELITQILAIVCFVLIFVVWIIPDKETEPEYDYVDGVKVE